jgi:hypothetical protein
MDRLRYLQVMCLRSLTIAGLIAFTLMTYSPDAQAAQTVPPLTPGMTTVPTVTFDSPGALLATNVDPEDCTTVPGGCAAGFTQITVYSAVYRDTTTGFLNFYYTTRAPARIRPAYR